MRQTRFRADLVAGEGLRISGMLAPYNQRGSGGDLFRPGLFDLAGADLLLYLQHDRGAALARTNAGLVVSDADQGILLAADLVDTDLGRRTHTLVGAGVLRGLSVEYLGREESEQVIDGLPTLVVTRGVLTGAAVVDRAAFPAAVVRTRADTPKPRRFWYF